MNKFLSYLLPFIAIFAFASLMEWYDARPVPGEPATVALVREFGSIPIPTAHVPVDNLTVLNRGSAIRVVRYFRAYQTANSILSYYEGALPGLGWQLADTTQRNSAEPTVRFCRAGRSLVIDAVPGENATTYYVGLAWAKRRDSDVYCPGSGAGIGATH
ncbi:hypothetical protein ACFFJT_15325 [Dyella flava]|uniref:Uncharacterized protein n=1 Tax=Dyella flava TaxID=1920170 RepID=A0ABS2K2R2_9GAMM|nr:hypothetical protein [Dyella flava]MBM7125526.1 hypothetical protein [Dyella flava]GLQ51612.1 hypothetical protein GCM10010872_30610 [Dyella flava]